METLVGVLIFATPIAALGALVASIERRRTRRRAEIVRQIALTDALHAQIGALVAPFVRWSRGRWQVSVAVPFERPAVVAGVLATVAELFARVAYEVVLSRQTAAAPPSRPQRTAPLGKESLSWT